MWRSCDQHRAVFGLSQITDQNGGLANKTKLTNTAKKKDPKLTRQGGVSELYFFKEMATKTSKKLIHWKTPDLL